MMEQIKPRATEIDKQVSNVTTVLVLILALIAFILSYNALREVAQDNGIPKILSYIWPLLVDFALVVFSLAILRASLLGERTFWYWVMVIGFAVTTIGFNFVHAPGNTLARIVAVVPPVALLLSFETLMSMVRSNVRRAAIIKPAQQANRERATTESKPLQPKRANKKSGDTIAAKERASQLLEAQPDMSGAELARQVGISAAYGRKLRNELAPQSETNGTGAQQ